MRELQFAGYSDDTFGLINDTKVDHDNCASGKPIVFKVYRESNDKEGMFVVGQYNAIPYCGAWLIGVSQLDDGMPLPAWVTDVSQAEHNEYTSIFTLCVPDDAVIEHVVTD